MNKFEIKVWYQRIKAFFNTKPVKYIYRIIFVIINLCMVIKLYFFASGMISLYTGITLSSVIKSLYRPHKVVVGERKFNFPPGFYLYGEPHDTTDKFIWAAVDESLEGIVYKEYYDIENAAYSDTSFEWFIDTATEYEINKVITKYKCGEYDVYLSRGYSFASSGFIMSSYNACIPENRINIYYGKSSICFKDFDYFKQLVKDLCFNDTDDELIFEEFLTTYE